MKSIQKIYQTSDSLSAPALSLDRIKIEYKKEGMNKSIMVSPINKADFIKQISVNIASHQPVPRSKNSIKK